MSILKKKKGIVSVLLTIAMVLTFLSPLTVYAADESILDAPNASVPATGEKADAKYEFIAKFIDGSTTVSTWGDGWEVRQIIDDNGGENRDFLVWNSTKVTNPDSYKGNIGQRYTNVGSYKGVTLDLVITINDWSWTTNAASGFIAFGTTAIEHCNKGFEWVDMTWQFVETGTNTPVELSGFMTINDIDWTQYIQFSAETSSHIDKLYASSDTWIKYAYINGEYKFYESNYSASNLYDECAMFTFLYSDCSELRFKWGQDEQSGTPTANDPLSTGIYFGYLAKKPLATETAEPTKTISDSDEINVNNNSLDAISEAFTYSIYHSVPDEWEDFYYSSYVFTDTICEILDILSIKIYDDGDNDVTSKFDIDITNNIVTASAKASFLSSADFYYNNYRFDIQVQIKDGADLSAYLVGSTDKSSTYQFPNQASITIDGDSAVSNEVTTNYTEVIPDEPVLPEIVKSIVDGDNLVSSKEMLNQDQTITFRGDVTVTNQVDLTSVVIRDELEAPFTYVDMKVYNLSGEDVTGHGTIAVDGQTVSFTFNTAYLTEIVGQKFIVKLTVSYDSSSDLSAYDNNTIPNQMDLIINAEITPSNEVTITPYDPISPEIVKSIVDGDNLVSTKEIDNENQTIIFQGNVTITNQVDLSSVIIRDVLEAPFNYVDMKVYNHAGEDITDHGTIAVDGMTVTFSFNTDYLTEIVGQKYTVELTVSYDSSTDLSVYDNNTIPNQMDLMINGEVTPSNKVTVVVKENTGTVDYNADSGGVIDAVKTGDYNILFIALAAILALSLVVIFRVKQKAKKSK